MQDQGPNENLSWTAVNISSGGSGMQVVQLHNEHRLSINTFSILFRTADPAGRDGAIPAPLGRQPPRPRPDPRRREQKWGGGCCRTAPLPPLKQGRPSCGVRFPACSRRRDGPQLEQRGAQPTPLSLQKRKPSSPMLIYAQSTAAVALGSRGRQGAAAYVLHHPCQRLGATELLEQQGQSTVPHKP